jgi:plasmid stabilization system protein ParE
MRVRFSQEALADLNSHLAYIKRRSPQGARRVRASIYAAAKRAAMFPEAARRRDEPTDEPGAVPGTREIVLPDYPYIMPYRVEDNTLIILRVFHAAQDR